MNPHQPAPNLLLTILDYLTVKEINRLSVACGCPRLYSIIQDIYTIFTPVSVGLHSIRLSGLTDRYNIAVQSASNPPPPRSVARPPPSQLFPFGRRSDIASCETGTTGHPFSIGCCDLANQYKLDSKPYPFYEEDKAPQLCVCESGRASSDIILNTPMASTFFRSHFAVSARDGAPMSMSALFSLKFHRLNYTQAFLPSPSPIPDMSLSSYYRQRYGYSLAFSEMWSAHQPSGVHLASYPTLLESLAANPLLREPQLHGFMPQNFAGNVQCIIPQYYHSVLAPRRIYRNSVLPHYSTHSWTSNGSLMMLPSAFLSSPYLNVYSPIAHSLPHEHRRANLLKWLAVFLSDTSYRATSTRSGHSYGWSPSFKVRRQQLLSSPLFAVLTEELLLPPSGRSVECLRLLPVADRPFDCRLVCPSDIALDLILRALLELSLSNSFPEGVDPSFLALITLNSEGVRRFLETPTVLTHKCRSVVLSFLFPGSIGVFNRPPFVGTGAVPIIRAAIRTISKQLVTAALKHSEQLQTELSRLSPDAICEEAKTLIYKTPVEFKEAVEAACWMGLLKD